MWEESAWIIQSRCELYKMICGGIYLKLVKKNGRNEILRWAGTLVRHLPDGNDLYRWKEEEMAERKSTTKTNGGAIV